MSKCFGDYWDYVSAGPPADETYTDPNNRDADRAPCNVDRRHVVNFNAVVATPEFTNSTARVLLSGWRVSGIFRRSSGAPVNVVSGQDRALTGVLLQRPDQVLDNPYGDKSGRPGTNWLNPAAFAQPALGTLGNTPRNSVVGPPTSSIDMALSRVFRLNDSNRSRRASRRYNVTNRFRPTFPPAGGGTGAFSQNLSQATFGQIRDSLDPRILQFAVTCVLAVQTSGPRAASIDAARDVFLVPRQEFTLQGWLDSSRICAPIDEQEFNPAGHG